MADFCFRRQLSFRSRTRVQTGQCTHLAVADQNVGVEELTTTYLTMLLCGIRCLPHTIAGRNCARLCRCPRPRPLNVGRREPPSSCVQRVGSVGQREARVRVGSFALAPLSETVRMPFRLLRMSLQSARAVEAVCRTFHISTSFLSSPVISERRTRAAPHSPRPDVRLRYHSGRASGCWGSHETSLLRRHACQLFEGATRDRPRPPRRPARA
jgi:hypothetical protein